MDGEAITDLILRAIAAMRERGELPTMEAPRLTVIPVKGKRADAYRANIGEALAAAQTDPGAHQAPVALGTAVANYLSEVVDLVPAYRDVAAIELAENGDVLISLHQ